MTNIKGLSITNDGSYKRIAITYDKIDDFGKVINSNIKVNRVITDSAILEAVSIIEDFAKTVVESK